MSKIPCPRCGLWNEKWDAACNHIKCGGEQGTPCDNPRKTNRSNQRITHYCAVCGREFAAHPSNATYNYDGTTIDNRMVRNGGHQPHYCTDQDRGPRRITLQKEGEFYKLLITIICFAMIFSNLHVNFIALMIGLIFTLLSYRLALYKPLMF